MKRKHASPRSSARTVEQAEFLTRKVAEDHGLPTGGLEEIVEQAQEQTPERGMAQSMARDELLEIGVRDEHARHRAMKAGYTEPGIAAAMSRPSSADVPTGNQDAVCVCGHREAAHTGDPQRGSACVGVPGRACACAGFTIQPRCDFCSGFPVAWRYPTRETPMRVPTGGGWTTHVSHAGWAVCDTCAALIERDDRKALSHRMPLMDVPPGYRAIARAKMRQMHRIQFFDARTGDREPV